MYSFQTGEKKTFQTVDYVIFAITLALSAAVGLYFAVKDRKKNTAEEFLLAGRRMHPIPVAVSMLSSFISAITILGTPAEVYVHSTMYWWMSVAFIITAVGAANIFIPVFYNLGVTSVFQYTEMRFGRVTRIISTIIYLVWMALYMAIVLYTPSLALNAVTGLSLWGSVVAISLVCIFYTTLMLIVYAGLLTLLVQGSLAVGGFLEAWKIADRDGRIVLLETNPDPRVRHSVWIILFGGSFWWCAIYGCNQAQVQRAVSVRLVSQSKIAIWLNLSGVASVVTLTCLVGVVMYAFYSTCDPVQFGLIGKPDQLFPLFMMDLLGNLHGLPGLLISCIFSGSLSTLSSGLNAVAAVLLEDYVKPFCCSNISQRKTMLLSRGFVVLFGLLFLVLAFAISQVGTMILQFVYTIFGVLGGPLLGMFSLGMLFPWANKWGGSIGMVTGLALTLWIGFGTAITKTSTALTHPVTTEGCNWNISDVSPTLPTQTLAVVTESFRQLIIDTRIQQLYSISYLFYNPIGCIITVVVGMLVSFMTGLTDPSTINPKLICPVFDIFFPFLPEKILKPLRFGVKHRKENDKEHSEDYDGTYKQARKDSIPLTMNVRSYGNNALQETNTLLHENNETQLT